MTSTPLRLKIQRLEQVCLFELNWGQGQQINAMLTYPVSLDRLYQDWQRAYLSFYKATPALTAPTVASPLRGRAVESGSVAPEQVDRRSALTQAEAKLLSEFHRWLHSAELFEIRTQIAQVGRQQAEQQQNLDLFLTCMAIDLARLPWETWEINSEFAAEGDIRIVRTPANIRSDAVLPKRRLRARMLVILGDETGLDFESDRAAVQSIASLVEIAFIGWQPGKTADQVKTEITQALTDPQGWDVLFFAGHSNEAQVTGGELQIAPKAAIAISEIATSLTVARSHGLQFALFNSCSGLNIAESLIDLGFSQVAIMREPIHNQVAQAFIVPFLRALSAHKDVHESLLVACQTLRLEKNLTYPSAHLIPSLFRHPGATLYQIPARSPRWKRWLQQMLPTRPEAIALAGCLTLSLFPPLHNVLLNQRVWLQAVYRDFTGQVPPAAAPAPVALIQIDETSTRRDPRLARPSPIDRSYLADVLAKLSDHNANIVGIDYLLDRPAGGEAQLRQTVETAIAQDQTWFVFGTRFNQFEQEWIFTPAETGIAQPEWSLQGYVSLFPNLMTLPYPNEDCRRTCPFAYLLALMQTAQRDRLALPQPQLTSQRDLRIQLLDSIERSEPISNLGMLNRLRLSEISAWSYEAIGLVWLEPIVDYSIPPDRVYERITAWRLLEQPLELPHLSQQVVIVGAGEYTDPAGVVGNALDLYPVPAAMQYWRDRLPDDNPAAAYPNGGSANEPTYLDVLTGAEVHAYMVHHLLTQRVVMPIPDLWMVGAVAIAAKVASVRLRQRPWSRRRHLRDLGLLAGAIAMYGVVGLQLYISAALLLPWALPSLTAGVFLLPALRKPHA